MSEVHRPMALGKLEVHLKGTYLFIGCAMWHVGPSSLTRDELTPPALEACNLSH